MSKNLYESLKEFTNSPTKQDKINALRRNKSFAMTNMLQAVFHPNVKFLFDEPVPYKRDNVPPGMAYSTFAQELDRVYLFIEGHPKASPNLTMKRRKELLFQVLEALEPKEADVYMSMICKKPPVKGLTYAIVKEAFPDLLP
jgi:hypothetical protein